MVTLIQNLPGNSGFKIGDRVEVFVAEFFHCISPLELQPMYRDWSRGDEYEVPGGTGWISGTVTEYDPDNIGMDGPCPLYVVRFDQMFDRQSEDHFPIEYLRHI